MTERARVEIESIAAGGDGVARVDGLVVFVPRSAPGDVGVVDYELRGRLARGRMVELERASAARVEPPCPHYTADRCGGCQLQHLGYEAQLAAKGRIVSDALARIGGHAVASPEVRPSPRPWRYRRKLTLALRRVGSRWVSGLHPYDAPGRVFDLVDCPITDERVLAAWA
ncbi:MAG TPA: TRAM domain-containing protein, partial [Gemmatimonadaceae bacterium]|nr:TRAM domain-containing protein [Gemmatimonadaceae bacterium]